nr:MAG TPA: hypothetical protein [Caudoviricetes sp.]
MKRRSRQQAPPLKFSGVHLGPLLYCQFSYSVHSTSTYML